MQKALVVTSLAFLVACSPLPPWPPQPSPGPTVAAQAARSSSPPPARGRAVRYAGPSDGGTVEVDLIPLADGRTRAEGSVTGTGGQMCMGVFSGNGSFRGRTLQVREENLPGCVVTLVRNGRSLSVDAGGRACGGLSGAGCSLSGTLTQR